MIGALVLAATESGNNYGDSANSFGHDDAIANYVRKNCHTYLGWSDTLNINNDKSPNQLFDQESFRLGSVSFEGSCDDTQLGKDNKDNNEGIGCADISKYKINEINENGQLLIVNVDGTINKDDSWIIGTYCCKPGDDCYEE